MKTNFFKRLLVLLLALVMTIPAVNGVEAEAASKATLSTKKMTIGIGSYGTQDVMDMYHEKETRYSLSVENSVKGAKYVFKSTDKDVVTVKKEGTVGYLTGVSAGTAKIKVKQKLNGETTLVGKCKVTVKEAAVEEVWGDNLILGTITGNCFVFSNLNPAAEYTYECADSNFTMVDARLEESDGYYIFSQIYTAKKSGTYTVTVKETYKNKTRTLGTYEFTVVAGTVEENINLYVGQEEYLDGYIYNCCVDGYWYELKEDGILTTPGGGCVIAEKAGTTTIDVWNYDAEKDGKGEFIGTITVTVTEE